MNFYKCLKYVFGNLLVEDIVTEIDEEIDDGIEEIDDEEIDDGINEKIEREIEEKLEREIKEQIQEQIEEVETSVEQLLLLEEAEAREFIIKEKNKELKEIYHKSLTLKEIMDELAKQMNEQQGILNDIHEDTVESKHYTMSALDKLIIKNLQAM